VRLDESINSLVCLQIPSRIEVGKTGWIKVILVQCYKRTQIDNRKRDEEREIKRQTRDW
jgi:hypothetical protein